MDIHGHRKMWAMRNPIPNSRDGFIRKLHGSSAIYMNTEQEHSVMDALGFVRSRPERPKDMDFVFDKVHVHPGVEQVKEAPAESLESLGLDPEQAKLLDRWVNRRLRRLEQKSEHYHELAKRAIKHNGLLIEERDQLQDEVNFLKATGYFRPDMSDNEKRKSRFSSFD